MAFDGFSTNKVSFIRSIPIYLFNVFLLFASTQTLSFLAFDSIHAIFFLVPLFYWTIFNPSLLPLWFVFLGGLMIDFSVDSLLGLHAFGFIIYMLVLYKTRRIILSQPPIYHFAIFAVSVVFFEILRWGLLSLLLWQKLDVFPTLLAIVINIVAFFPILLVLKGLHRLVSGYGQRLG